jgi:hypothetical protein
MNERRAYDRLRSSQGSIGVLRRLTISVVVIVMSLVHAAAQTPDPQAPGQVSDPARPALNPFPAEQDWSFLARLVQHPDFFDPAKYIRLGDDSQRYISFGLEYRTEYEYYDNWMPGAGPQDHNGYVLSRVMPHFDLHAGPDFRLFSEWEFDYVAGRVGGPRPNIDEDAGDIHQTFVEIGPHVSSSRGSSLRLGRQEVVLGSGRLFDNNEGPNVKLSFDGARWITQTSHLRWDAFVLKPVENNTGFFDDHPNAQQTTWGSYLTIPLPIVPRGMTDLYYIGFAAKNEAVATDLADNIAHGVCWHDATIVAEELGCNLFLEMPPGHTLTDLVEENVPGVTASVVTTDLFRHVLRLAAA